jgi:OPA family sugar phosphate sensor protein UhpC-like MFS transporter
MPGVQLKEGRNLANSLAVRVIKEALARSGFTAPHRSDYGKVPEIQRNEMTKLDESRSLTASTQDRSLDRAYRPWQVRIFIATWLAYAGYYFCRKPFYVVKADMGWAFGLSSVQLGHLGTAYLAAYAVGQFSSAYFGRRLGPKLLLVLGIAVSVACNFIFGISNGFWTLMLFLAINGVAQGTGWPGCIGSLAFWFRRGQRGSILGVWSTCYQLGSCVSTAFAAYMLGRAGWRWSYFGSALVLLAVWAVVLLLHPNRPENVGLSPIEEEADGTDGAEPPKQRAELAGSGEDVQGLGWTADVVISLLTMGVIYFTIKFLRYALWSWAPFFLRQNFQLSGAKAGYLSTVFELCGFFGVIASGVASDKLFHGRRAFLSFAMLAMMTLSFTLMATLGAKSLFFFTLSMGLAGFMLFGPDALLSGVGAIDVGSKRGALAAAGIINGMGSIGPIFQEEIIGWMYKASGQRIFPILVMLVCVAAAGTFVTFLLWMRARKGKANL